MARANAPALADHRRAQLAIRCRRCAAARRSAAHRTCRPTSPQASIVSYTVTSPSATIGRSNHNGVTALSTDQAAARPRAPPSPRDRRRSAPPASSPTTTTSRVQIEFRTLAQERLVRRRPRSRPRTPSSRASRANAKYATNVSRSRARLVAPSGAIESSTGFPSVQRSCAGRIPAHCAARQLAATRGPRSPLLRVARRSRARPRTAAPGRVQRRQFAVVRRSSTSRAPAGRRTTWAMRARVRPRAAEPAIEIAASAPLAFNASVNACA